jgi:hypothetical protein
LLIGIKGMDENDGEEEGEKRKEEESDDLCDKGENGETSRCLKKEV